MTTCGWARVECQSNPSMDADVKRSLINLRLHISAVEGLLQLHQSHSANPILQSAPACVFSEESRKSALESTVPMTPPETTSPSLRGFDDESPSPSSSSSPHSPCQSILDWHPITNNGACVRYPEEVRKERVRRYLFKRNQRRFGTKKIRYEVRKTLANNRPRVKGRFVKPSESSGRRDSISSVQSSASSTSSFDSCAAD
mmetsp:Transcript_43338/g.70330  ORF Transcript_43338/g.70330 Transcript_43338/m.70330 type:complete len:200 (-) Transcript_43338:45-644(-)